MQNYTRKEVDDYATIRYYNNQNQFHRTDGPAVELRNGVKAWFINGKLHRTDGPAVEHSDGDKEWWINDKRYTEQEFNKHPEVLKYRMLEEAKKNVRNIKMKIKIDKYDLQLIAEAAKDLFREIDPRDGDLTYNQFLGKCYLMACAKVLKVEVEYPNRQPVEPVDS